MIVKNYAILLILTFYALSSPMARANSEQVSNANNLPESANLIAEYIANIKSTAIEFTQNDSHGNVAHGMLVINKPYKFRCNYYEPFPLLIIGNKNYISVYDYEMKYIARIKASENAFNFLLLDQIDFQNQFEIVQITQQGNLYLMKFKSFADDKLSEIIFDKKSGMLKKLTIFEDDNHIILTFGESYNLTNIPNDLFILQNPDMFGPPARWTQEDLYKKLKISK